MTVEIAGEEPGSTPKKPENEEMDFARTKGKKDDWRQFFQHNDDPRWQEPDFNEEGWAKPTKKKKK